MNCDEECAADKAEAKEFAYFSGITTGRLGERKRIIELLTEAKAEKLTPEEAINKGWKFDEPTGIWWLPQETLIALIKGENK
jgi:hypothetical protein